MLVAPPISPDGSAAPVDALLDFFLGETLASLADDPQVPEGIAQATLTRAVVPGLDRDDHLRSTRLLARPTLSASVTVRLNNSLLPYPQPLGGRPQPG